MSSKTTKEEGINKWMPTPDISGTFFLESLINKYDSFCLTLISDETGQKLEISFDFYYGFRSFDESFRLKLWGKNNGLFKSWSFYHTKESEFIDWFNSETFGIYVQNLVHFMIGAGDEIIDVISNQYPTCSWLK